MTQILRLVRGDAQSNQWRGHRAETVFNYEDTRSSISTTYVVSTVLEWTSVTRCILCICYQINFRSNLLLPGYSAPTTWC